MDWTSVNSARLVRSSLNRLVRRLTIRTKLIGAWKTTTDVFKKRWVKSVGINN